LRGGSPPQNATHTAFPDDIPDTATATTKRLAEQATKEMPADVGIGIVNVDTTPLGRATAHTHRLLGKYQTPINGLQTNPPLLEGVIASLCDQPHALAVGFHRGPNKTIEIAIRLVEFEPTTQIESRDEFAAAHASGSVTADALTSAFEQAGYSTMTNWELPEHTGWQLETLLEDRQQDTALWRKKHRRTRNDTDASLGMALATAPHEYAEVFKQTPADPLAEHYDSVGLYSRLEVSSGSLSALLPLKPRNYNTSLWEHVPGRTTPRITPVAPIQVPAGMTAANTDPTVDSHNQPTADLDGEYTSFGRTVCRWLRQRGHTLEPIESDIEGLQFRRVDPDGSRRLVLCLEASPPTDSTSTPSDPLSALSSTGPTASDLQPGDLIAASRLAIDQQYDGLDVFCQTEAIAEDAFSVVVAPVQATSPTETHLYSDSRLLRSTGAVGLRPIETPPEQWTITNDHSLECRLDGGDPRAACRYGEPLAGLVDQLPRVRYDARTETYTVSYPTERRPRDFETQSELLRAYRPVRRPARPGTVGSLLDTTRVFSKTKDSLHFSPTRITASWDRPLTAKRTAEAAAVFLERYTIKKPNATLAVSAVLAEFVPFVRYQSDKPLGGSYRNVFSEYARDGKIHGRAWRYNPEYRHII